jgi:arylsulfatase A-like enzyme
MIELGFHPDPDRFLFPMRDAYMDEIEHADRCVGSLLDGLRARGLYDDALIVVTADHGETLYEEQLHVPLIIKLPGNHQAGAVNTGFARHVDLVPTLLGCAAIPVPSVRSVRMGAIRSDQSVPRTRNSFLAAVYDLMNSTTWGQTPAKWSTSPGTETLANPLCGRQSKWPIRPKPPC